MQNRQSKQVFARHNHSTTIFMQCQASLAIN